MAINRQRGKINKRYQQYSILRSRYRNPYLAWMSVLFKPFFFFEKKLGIRENSFQKKVFKLPPPLQPTTNAPLALSPEHLPPRFFLLCCLLFYLSSQHKKLRKKQKAKTTPKKKFKIFWGLINNPTKKKNKTASPLVHSQTNHKKLLEKKEDKNKNRKLALCGLFTFSLVFEELEFFFVWKKKKGRNKKRKIVSIKIKKCLR